MRLLALFLALNVLGVAAAEAGSCRCRSDRDAAGRLCGGRSAEARAGGLVPECGVPSTPPTSRSGKDGETTNPFGVGR